jgi:predicted transcriptional regulator
VTKTVTFTIRSEEELFSQFAETYRAVRVGRRVRRHEGVSFTSIEAARNFLTPARLALLRAVRGRRPGSVYALAKIVGRDLKNVQQDLKILEQHGLVKMIRGRGTGKRAVTVPTALCREIALRIAI